MSVVTIAEIKSLARQLNWGSSKIQALEQILSTIPVLYINTQIVEHYIEIDVFSQQKDSRQTLSFTPRNMGKNDLWIAATACFIKAELITTDKDFDHLNSIFLPVHDVKQ